MDKPPVIEEENKQEGPNKIRNEHDKPGIAYEWKQIFKSEIKKTSRVVKEVFVAIRFLIYALIGEGFIRIIERICSDLVEKSDLFCMGLDSARVALIVMGIAYFIKHTRKAHEDEFRGKND